MTAPIPERHPAGRTCAEATITTTALLMLIAALIRKAVR